MKCNVSVYFTCIAYHSFLIDIDMKCNVSVYFTLHVELLAFISLCVLDMEDGGCMYAYVKCVCACL